MRSELTVAGMLLLLACEPEPPRCDGDCSPPQVVISRPSAGQLMQGLAAVEGTVTDLSAAALQLELLVDGKVVDSTESSDRYSMRFDAEVQSVGDHVLVVRATDAAGNEGAAELRVTTRPMDLDSCAVNRWQRLHWYADEALGRPDAVWCEPGPIDYDWGYGSPDANGPNETFTVRWLGTWELEAGTYDFAARVDDGMRLWVDGELIIDEWRQHSPTDFTARRVMAAGAHAVRLDYYEATGIAVIRLGWARLP